jgi:hypothetical protein
MQKVKKLYLVESAGQNILELKEDITPKDFVELSSDEEENIESLQEPEESSARHNDASNLNSDLRNQMPGPMGRQMSSDNSNMSSSPCSKQGNNEINRFSEGSKKSPQNDEKLKKSDKFFNSPKSSNERIEQKKGVRLPIPVKLPCTHIL